MPGQSEVKINQYQSTSRLFDLNRLRCFMSISRNIFIIIKHGEETFKGLTDSATRTYIHGPDESR